MDPACIARRNLRRARGDATAVAGLRTTPTINSFAWLRESLAGASRKIAPADTKAVGPVDLRSRPRQALLGEESSPCLQHLAAGDDPGAITGGRHVRINDFDRPLEDWLALNAVHEAADELCSTEPEPVEYRFAKIATNELRVVQPSQVQNAVMPSKHRAPQVAFYELRVLCDEVLEERSTKVARRYRCMAQCRALCPKRREPRRGDVCSVQEDAAEIGCVEVTPRDCGIVQI